MACVSAVEVLTFFIIFPGMSLDGKNLPAVQDVSLIFIVNSMICLTQLFAHKSFSFLSRHQAFLVHHSETLQFRIA